MTPETKQLIFASSPLLSMMTVGMVCAFPATLVPSLLDPASDVTTDKATAAWIASISGVSGIWTILTLSPMMHYFGRRRAHLYLTFSTSLGWVLTSCAHSVRLLIFGRILHSLTYGGIYFHSVCIGELTRPSIRGYMLGLKCTSASIGIFIIHLCGSCLHWRSLALVPLVPTVLSMIICYFWPESPEWLVSVHRYDEAKEVFFSLRGKTKESEVEILKIIAREQDRVENGKRRDYVKDCLEKLQSRVLWRPVSLLVVAVLLPEFGGRQFFPSYSLQMVEQITGDKNNVFTYTYAIDAISVFAATSNFIFLKNFKRRSLLISSASILITLLICLSVLMYVKDKYGNNSIIIFISLGIICLYFLVGFSCVFPLAYALMGELFPLEYRSIGTLIDGILLSGSVTLTLRLTPTLIDSVGMHGLFLTMATSMSIFLAYVYIELPETKDRTLHDIGEYFRGNSGKFGDTDRAVNVEELEAIKK